jgi:hypothetical protein
MGLYYRPESSLSSSVATVLAFCPSGKLLAGAAPNHVSLWSTMNGREKYHIDTRASAVTCISWSSSTWLQCGLENGYLLSVSLHDESQVKPTTRNLTPLLIISRLFMSKEFAPIRLLYLVFHHIQVAVIWQRLPVMRYVFGNGQEVSPFVPGDSESGIHAVLSTVATCGPTGLPTHDGKHS